MRVVVKNFRNYSTDFKRPPVVPKLSDSDSLGLQGITDAF